MVGVIYKFIGSANKNIINANKYNSIMGKKEIAKPLFIRLYEGDEDIIQMIEDVKTYSKYRSNSKVVKIIMRNRK